jgi:Uma2 family endonuclease
MIEAGILSEDERVELLEGVIVAMSPQRHPHAWAIEWLTRFLVRALGDEYRVRPQLPLTLGEHNEPEPDLAVIRADSRTKDRHPDSALLVIEVADDSLRKDRTVKAALYARCRIPEYWIVGIEEEVIEVLTDPDATAATYRRVRTLKKEDTVLAESIPGISFSVRDLFA